MESKEIKPRSMPIPARLQARPKDHRGYVVPWFVAWIDGKPDFRVIDAAKIAPAVKDKRCWLCGEKLGRNMAFVIGPMCAINRTSSEPPSHLECAEYAVQVCPFLTLPKAQRRDIGEAEFAENGLKDAAGFGIKRNPGATCIWVTKFYWLFSPPGGGVLFEMGDPEAVHWYCKGRRATRAEAWHSIETGLPLLQEMAEAEGEGAVAELEAYVERTLPLLPVEVA